MTHSQRAGTLKLVFVRHGDAFDVAGRCIGHTDVALSEEGALSVHRLMAETSAEFASDHVSGARSLSIASSDLQRAVQTAEIVANSLALPYTTDVRLREMNFGEWDGRWWSELETADGERLRAWMENWTEIASPGGEAVAELQVRVNSWLEDYHVISSGIDRTVIVISHAGFIRAALCQLLAIPISQMFDIPVSHARATTVMLTNDRAPVLVTADAPLIS